MEEDIENKDNQQENRHSFDEPRQNYLQYFGPYLLAGLAILSLALVRLNTEILGGEIENPSQLKVSSTELSNIHFEINPKDGYEINARYGNLGPKMIDAGVIDSPKFTDVYKQSQPLTPEQLEILTKGSDQKIKITTQNSYFLLNYFWAVGLANKSEILDAGEMVRDGRDQAGNFASTGGWTLGKGNAMDYYSKFTLIKLTGKQEKLVKSVASNVYRPCCDNSTAFPDCNHGMALLGMLELMAANNANEVQMYEASKYFNAFWFSGQYGDIALYFKNKEGKSYKDLDGKVVLSKAYSSATGYQNVKEWLSRKGLINAPSSGASCGA
ncbi:MAG: hypothetical protein M1355_04345 [Patescibacteria group bacterium]|nr:hypothetical protein [Patescibacteria group bacterium]